MKYRDFLVKSKLIISLVQTMKIRPLDFHCLGLLFSLLFYEFSATVLPKRFKSSIRVWNYAEDVKVQRSNRWRHLLCWRNGFSARNVRRTVTDCGIFFCADFLRFVALNAIWAHFLLDGTLRFHPILYPPNTLNNTKIAAKWLEKSLFSDVRVEE